MAVSNCPYCKSATRPEWTYCKGCHWTIPAGVTLSPARVQAVRTNGITKVRVTSSGMPAREFENLAHGRSFAKAYKRMGDAIYDVKWDIGRTFLPAIEKALRPLSKILGA